MQDFGKRAAGVVSMLTSPSVVGGRSLFFHFSDRKWGRCQEEMDPF